MRRERLKRPEVGKTIDTGIRREQSLKRSADPQKICQLVDRRVFGKHHDDRQPDEDAAQMKRKIRLDGERAVINAPGMP